MEGSNLFSDGEWTRAQQELGLSRRQAQIVRLVLEGNADKQIAHELDISLTTVRTHLHRLFEKFKLNDRLELTLLVLTSLRGRLHGDSEESPSNVPHSVLRQDDSVELTDPSTENEQDQLRKEDTVQ